MPANTAMVDAPTFRVNDVDLLFRIARWWAKPNQRLLSIVGSVVATGAVVVVVVRLALGLG